MDKRILVIIIVIVLSIGGGITYLLNSSADSVAVKEMVTKSQQRNPRAPIAATPAPATPATTEPKPTSPTPNSSGPGVYKNYGPAVIAETTGTKLLFFHAAWCPQCRDLEADIKQKGVPTGVAIIKVDYDNHQSLRQKYGVTLQTTLVRVDDQGNLVKKYVSYDEPTLEAVKRNLL